MAVQFSWAQGAAAGCNILRRIRGESALPYRPRDLGYLIPLASGKAWGEVMGTPVGGRLGSFLHYFMCIYRTHLFSARLGIVSDLFCALFPRVL
jgi:NADH dehydrogenase FAD-containing subunit